MVPAQAFIDAIATAIGADTDWLAAPTTFVALHLAKAAFTPSPALDIGTLEEANFVGYAAIHAASAATQVFKEPDSEQLVIQVREPAGGWHFETTSGVGLPQTVYGYYLTSSDGTDLIGSALLPDGPFTFTDNGQGLDIAQVRFLLDLIPLT